MTSYIGLSKIFYLFYEIYHKFLVLARHFKVWKKQKEAKNSMSLCKKYMLYTFQDKRRGVSFSLLHGP